LSRGELNHSFSVWSSMSPLRLLHITLSLTCRSAHSVPEGRVVCDGTAALICLRLYLLSVLSHLGQYVLWKGGHVVQVLKEDSATL
jgi:hypothetical protein